MWYTPIYDKLKKENDDSSGLEGRHIKCVCPRNEVAVLVVKMNFKTFLDVRGAQYLEKNTAVDPVMNHPLVMSGSTMVYLVVLPKKAC